eukprot:6566558-Heterocapsa_arctica.AAC.1
MESGDGRVVSCDRARGALLQPSLYDGEISHADCDCGGKESGVSCCRCGPWLCHEPREQQ